jgi:hypothetical protein
MSAGVYRSAALVYRIAALVYRIAALVYRIAALVYRIAGNHDIAKQQLLIVSGAGQTFSTGPGPAGESRTPPPLPHMYTKYT